MTFEPTDEELQATLVTLRQENTELDEKEAELEKKSKEK